MRPLDEIKQKRRYEMFNYKSREKVLELNSFFGKYNMQFEERIKKTFIYYDTPNKDLEKSNIILYKTVIGKFCELNMATDKTNVSSRYNYRIYAKHFQKQIKPNDKILRHKEFLIDSFKGMFLSSINFDPEFLLRKLEPAYIIETVSDEFRSVNLSGLKITYSFDRDFYTNCFSGIKTETNIMTIYQHSGEKTDEDFEDLNSKLIRYCKELTPVNSSKINLARKNTQEKLEQIQKAKAEKDKAKLLKKKK
ncbi:MAG: hypothetical protein E7374_01840 [Clostridiales bacterium]|nr:hypothetical protein [Clostridiales bacterium]